MADGDIAGQCRLLAGAPAFAAQGVLAVLAFSSLVLKRHREKPQRPVLIWGLDVSKQVVSMLAAHICGMLIAIIAHRSSAASSECAWYFVAYTFDTTLGLLLTVVFHKAIIKAAKMWKKRFAHHGRGVALGGESWYDVVALCGNYGDPPSLYKWGLQLGEWVACVVAARAVCGTLVILLGRLLIHIAQALDRAFEGHPTLLLFSVMIACPLLMNMVQVLIQDTILKWRRSVSSASLSRMDILLEPKQGQQAQQGDHEEAGLLDGVPTSTAA